MSLSELEKDDLPVLFFRASFDLGRAVEKNREALHVARYEQGDLDFPGFVLDRSKNWIDAHVDALANQDYDGHVEFVRRKIVSDITPGPGSLNQCYAAISDDLKAISTKALADELSELAKCSFQNVESAIAAQGGPASKLRWEQCHPAALAFSADGEGYTRCTFKRGDGTKPDTITLRIGGHLDSARDPQKGALRTFFTMDFNLCHEYVSHSFARWDDRKHILAEGMLVWLAAEIVRPTSQDFLRRHLVKDTLAHRLSAPDPNAGERAAEWFSNTTEKRPFSAFLLDWAASPAHPDNSIRAARMCYLANSASSGNGIVIKKIREIFLSGNTEEIHQWLDELTQKQILPHQSYKRHLQ